MSPTITIRRSTPSDAEALADLAALDSRRALTGDALLAYAGDELHAALPLDGTAAIADPFRHTAEIVALLHVSAAHLYGTTAREPRRLRSLRLRTA